MARLTRIAACLLGACLAAPGARASAAPDDYVFYYENVMGTSLELRVRADDPAAARRAEGRVLAEIDRLTDVFSGHDRSSELSRWQSSAAGPVRVSAELFELLRASDDWRARSGGAFDPRVQVLTDLWSRAEARGRAPTARERAEARALMGRPAWRLEPDARTAERLSDAPISLNAIAKGYIVERACAAALEPARGVRGLLLNIGGDLRACGDIARVVGVADPRSDSDTGELIAYLEVRDRAVATSGRSRRGFRIDGAWYSHIFDPRTGLPADEVAGATVVAGSSADADALATVLNVLPPEEGARLADALPDVACLIVAADGRVVRSAGWPRYERARPVPVVLADGPGSAGKPQAPAKPAARDPWAGEWEVAVHFEINRPDAAARGYRRPYVAVWVEDEDGAVVRNVALWVSHGGAGPYQWAPEMKRWYKSDEARRQADRTDMIQTISRPTRPPGKYTVVWDGKDDRGRPVGRGEYTIFLDAAREHGTYQNIRKRVKLAGTPFAEELKGNVEIKSASIEYRRTRAGK